MTSLERLNVCFEKMEIQADEKVKEKLLSYMHIVLKQNETMNLTAINNEEEFIEKNLADCAVLTKELPEGACVLDVGSGSGLPGLVLAVMREDIHVTMMDSLKKRCDFLERTIKELRINNAEVILSRAEDAGHNSSLRENFDVVSARALAPMGTLLELCAPFVRVGGTFIAMKAKAAEEASNAVRAANLLGVKMARTKGFILPFEKSVRTLYFYEKISKTQEKYPRRANAMKNNPL